MRGIRTIAVTGLLSLALAGCMSSGSRQEAGSSVMALTSPASAEDTTIGLIGGAVGAELSATDRRAAMDAEFRALEYGRAGAPVQWRGRSGRVWGDVWAGARYEINDFACRDYTHTVTIGGEPQVARGTACRQPDGTWKAVG
jgi:surface antigen